MDGLTVAATEYDKELRARRDAEAEVTRLRILLSGQAARLTAISGESRKQEAQKALSRDLSDSLSVLQRDLSKLKVERDMTLAEVEELSASKRSALPLLLTDNISSTHHRVAHLPSTVLRTLQPSSDGPCPCGSIISRISMPTSCFPSFRDEKTCFVKSKS